MVTTVLDDAPPGTQEYIMLRQDSIQSAELKKKESPFRAKCHEIFCCPLKQVHHKENTEPEGLFKTDTCFACVLSLCSLSLPTLLSCFGLCIAVWCAVYCSVPVTAIGDPGSLVSVLCSVRWDTVEYSHLSTACSILLLAAETFSVDVMTLFHFGCQSCLLL